MTIAKVLASVQDYFARPRGGVNGGTLCELSLMDRHGAGHRLSDDACTSLVEDYQRFTY